METIDLTSDYTDDFEAELNTEFTESNSINDTTDTTEPVTAVSRDELGQHAYNLERKILEYVDEKSANGIKQHSKEWSSIRQTTIGGSSLATIQGKNPYNSVQALISERIGFTNYESSIKPQWGNLFEDVIKRVVEYQKKCTVHGEDLYVRGQPYNGSVITSYSPDGLAVITRSHEHGGFGHPEIALLEFKCPYGRIPNGVVPKYYVPQVKMGLELLEIPTVGLFAEAVFRRCSWDTLGYNKHYDTQLVKVSSGELPLAFGIIGFYKYEGDLHNGDVPSAADIKDRDAALAAAEEYFGELGDESNGYMTNDLGTTPLELFTRLMDILDRGLLRAWYGRNIHTDVADNITNSAQILHKELDSYMDFCEAGGHINIGMLPWKLFRVDYNYIEKENNYIAPWMPKIEKIVNIIRKCNLPENADKKYNIYQASFEDI